MNSVPCVVILVAILVADCLDACVAVRARVRSSLSESDFEDVGEVPVGDQNSLCVGVCGEEHGLLGHWEMTMGGIAFSGSDIAGDKRISGLRQDELEIIATAVTWSRFF